MSVSTAIDCDNLKICIKMFKKTAYDYWKQERNVVGIVTLCKDLDEAIGNGIPLRVITTLIGPPGCGKTQICLQLCVNVQISKNLRGLDGAAVFIDTNRGFTVNRLKEIINATYKHCEHVYEIYNIAHNTSTFTVDNIMENIHCSFCNNYVELLAAVYNLRELLIKNQKIRLIVIDSFSYLFRSIDKSNTSRVHIFYQILSELQSLAEKYNCAVVISNEITTHVTASDELQLVPALGDSYTHRVNYQITIGRDPNSNQLFVANIDKSFFNAEKMIPFRITKDGIRQIKRKKERPTE